ncbi:MAG: Omp28-related outer membrane protein [Flavobacteriales bacterium]
MKNLIFILGVLLAFSCDYVDEPLVKTEGGAGDCVAPTFPQNTNTKRNILIEDFTGQQCTFCPAAAYIIDTIKDNLGSQIIPVGLHVGGFSVPLTSGTKYRTDFRTPGGTEIYNRFAPNAPQPALMVNRYDGFNTPASFNISYFALSTNVRSMINDVPTLNMQSLTSTDPSTGDICVFTEVEVLTTLSDDHSIVVMLLEDSIIDWQKYSGSLGDPIYGSGQRDIPDYKHEHVLRKSVNGWQGKTILSSANAVGEKIIETNKILGADLDGSWNSSKFEIVTFVYNNRTKEVMQAAHTKL